MNNSNIKKGITIGVIVCALILVGVLGSYAFFINAIENNKNEELNVETGTLALTFNDGNPGFNKELEFGSSAEKKFTVENTGTLDAIAKINWKNLINMYIEGSIIYSLSYYENEGDTPTEIITDKTIPRSETPVTEVLAGKLSIPAGKTYNYTLVITLNYLESTDQTADLNAFLNTEFSLEEDTLETEDNTFATSLVTKANKVSASGYESGNKGEMYTFEHAATDQTPALTDYRYLGANANNYVSFNDETWKIVGVFSVQSEENGEYEQRVKITKSELMDPLAWNTSNDNWSWPDSSLSQILNEAYYIGNGRFTETVLNETARNQVAQAKWYLGGSDSQDAETLYNVERDSSTINYVGLLYPSDFYYTYVNDKSWLRETSAIEWTMYVQHILSSADVLYTIDDATKTLGYRPTVYLRSDIEVTDGTGTSSDPYILSV